MTIIERLIEFKDEEITGRGNPIAERKFELIIQDAIKEHAKAVADEVEREESNKLWLEGITSSREETDPVLNHLNDEITKNDDAMFSIGSK